MQPRAASETVPFRREGPAGRWTASVVLSACWAVTGAALALWVFRAWAHPVPAFNPDDGPIGPNANLSFWVGGFLMGVPLAGLSAALASVGLGYVWRVGSAPRIRAAWISAVCAAVAVEVVFIGTFMAPGMLFGMTPGQVNWGLLGLSALFAATGAAMTIILTTAHARLRADAGVGAGLRG
jgi:hypothetical protein